MNLAAGVAPLVELTRGGMVECTHFGAIAVVDSHGNLLASSGDADLVTFPRSSMKPLQALPFVERQGVEAFDLSEEELAILCASHTGTDAHVAVLKSIHQKVGLRENDLQCGTHWPYDGATSQRMRCQGEEPTPYRHNCSGKHSGMLAHAKLRGLSLDNYLERDHPVQQAIRQSVAEMCGMPEEDLIPGIDGCSAPVYAMPLRNFALAIARLCDPHSLTPGRQEACQKITHAMAAFPTMVAGPGRLDTILMKTFNGKAICKGGAEGYQIIGLMPDAVRPGAPGIGIAFKFSDGDPSRRATHCLTIELLKAFGFEQQVASPSFEAINQPILRNWRGLEVGEIRLATPITWHSS